MPAEISRLEMIDPLSFSAVEAVCRYVVRPSGATVRHILVSGSDKAWTRAATRATWRASGGAKGGALGCACRKGAAKMTTALRWLLAPVWAAQIFTGAKSFCDNRILGDVRLNERGLHVWRVRLANRMAEARRAKLASRLSPEDRAEFAANGFILKRNFLPEDQFRALVDEIGRTEAPVREMKQATPSPAGSRSIRKS
ncbi:hypothetical protein [Chenggangzhangella methanolivorans]|uniref:hypothetical protein n=1 Tax=Chenggangzhangella methanolivorans TaxID=1437009 RepID=UPI0028F41878|nr:hypothetical protein [Chenggangzhangella methanolivorans]